MGDSEFAVLLATWVPSLWQRIALVLGALAVIYLLASLAARKASSTLRERFTKTSPNLTRRLRNLYKVARTVFTVACLLSALYLLTPQLSGQLQGISLALSRLTRVAGIVVFAMFLYWVLLLGLGILRQSVADEDDTGLSDLEQRTQTITSFFHSIGLAIIGTIAGLMILESLGLEIGPILAGAGIAGVAIGLGAQSLVKDMLSGFLILLEDHFRVGDFVQTAGLSGTVEHMTMRCTWLRAFDGTLNVVPNGEIRTVSNKSKNWARVKIDVRIPYDEDIDRVEALLQGLVSQLVSEDGYKEIVREQPAILSANDLDTSWVTLTILLMTSTGNQWAISRDLRKRIVKAFQSEGIPFAHSKTIVQLQGRQE